MKLRPYKIDVILSEAMVFHEAKNLVFRFIASGVQHP